MASSTDSADVADAPLPATECLAPVQPNVVCSVLDLIVSALSLVPAAVAPGTDTFEHQAYCVRTAVEKVFRVKGVQHGVDDSQSLFASELLMLLVFPSRERPVKPDRANGLLEADEESWDANLEVS